MIKGLIFDCYGVLATESLIPFRHKYFDHDPVLLQTSIELTRQATAGLITQPEFVARLADMARLTPAQVHAAIEGNTANEPLFDYIRQELKPHYKIGLLSNAASNRLATMFSEEQLGLFDAITLSYETGTIKPEARAYQMAVERLAITPAEAVMIDDQERYCIGAREAGMQAVQYQNLGQLQAGLKTVA